jgi:hypothetical protein
VVLTSAPWKRTHAGLSFFSGGVLPAWHIVHSSDAFFAT